MTIVEKALPLWDLQGATATLIAARENAVYRIDHHTGCFALRLHRQGYRTDRQLAAELGWMAWLVGAGLSIPAPVPSRAGTHLQHVEGVQVDMLTWLEGQTLDAALPSLDTTARRAVFRQLGRTMAQLHEASDRWPNAATCDRPSWNTEGLLGERPLWDRFWKNPALTPRQQALMSMFRQRAVQDLTALSDSHDYGLIHADLVPANALWTGEGLHVIDFDDGGFGFRLFEIVTALLKHRSDPGYADLQDALIDGYTALRPLDIRPLPLFMALRAVTYVGWNITRLGEDETGTRNARFIAQAEDLVTAYLDQGIYSVLRKH